MKRLLAALAVVALLAGMASTAGLTVNHEKVANVAPTLRIATARVIFDSAYLTGGESLTAGMLGLNDLDYVMVTPDSIACAGYQVGYDPVNSTLFVLGYEDTITVAAFSTTDTLTAVTPLPDSLGLTIFTAAQTITLTLEEIDSGTDLSAVAVRVIAYDFTN